MSPTGERAAPAELRQITVLFCDLVGSTALSCALGPEEYRNVIRAYHSRCSKIVTSLGGTIAQYLGDGVMARFGFPQAHEDDAVRAVRCALELIEDMGASGKQLEIRIGIATGIVVVGDASTSEVGETPNLAARLQTAAAPGSVIIADNTKKLIGANYSFTDLGTLELKGYNTPVHAWAVNGIAERGLHGTVAELSPLIGRDEEMEILLRRWRRACSRKGSVVLISGEPGIGKSRLVSAIQGRIASEPHMRLQYFCTPYHQTSPLYPVISQLSRAAKFERGDDLEVRQEKLVSLLSMTSTAAEDLALIADLFSLAGGDRYAKQMLSPQQRKDRTLSALIQQLKLLARQKPVLMVFENVHWSDPTTRELLDLAIEAVKLLPVLVLITFRPEFTAPWIGQSQVTLLSLNRLDRVDGAALAKRTAGASTFSDDTIRDIVARSDGIPLFVEELTKSILDTGGLGNSTATIAPLSGSAVVPHRLHSSLLARLDATGVAKETAQVGSAIGREFSFELLTEVAKRKPESVKADLEVLVQAGLIIQRGTPPGAIYYFKHALIQDAAYGTLLREPRQRLHARITEVLARNFPELALPELLAQHYSSAGLHMQAAEAWRTAGVRASVRAAYEEAVAHYSEGIKALRLAVPDRETKVLELDLLLLLTGALAVPRGISGQDFQSHLHRAIELAEELGDSTRLHKSLFIRWQHLNVQAKHADNLVLARQMIAAVHEGTDAVAKRIAHTCMGSTAFVIGELPLAIQHLEQGFDPNNIERMTLEGSGQDITGYALFFICRTYALAGLGSRAASLAQRAVERTSTVQSRGLALCASAHVNWSLGDLSGLRADVNSVLQIGHDINGAYHQGIGGMWAGWLIAQEAEPEAGLAQFQRAFGIYRNAGYGAALPFFLGLLAQIHLCAGKLADGLSVIAEALALSEATLDKSADAELLRLRGELLAADPKQLMEAEANFKQAIDLARIQQAITWELRASTSLARLWLRVGNGRRAQKLLGPICTLFGDDAKWSDLTGAKELLANTT